MNDIKFSDISYILGNGFQMKNNLFGCLFPLEWHDDNVAALGGNFDASPTEV